MTNSSSSGSGKQGSFSAARTLDRNVEITGKPPRIEPHRTEEVLAPARQLMAKISGAASGKATAVPGEHIPDDRNLQPGVV